MAKKTSTKAMRSRSKAKKITPAVRYLRYNIANSATPGTETSHYIDLAKDLSAVNRRLMRQGRNYHVKRITVTSSNTIAFGSFTEDGIIPSVQAFQQNAGRISVSALPFSWTAVGAWKRGMKTWQMMNAEALKATAGDLRSTWSDFKVYLTDDMRTGTILSPIDNGNNAVTAGEWAYTILTTPDGTTGADNFYLHMLGNHNGGPGARISVGLIKSFGESRSTVQEDDPNSPGTAADDPLVNVFDYGTTIDEVIDRVTTDGDLPPYDIDDYAGDDANMPKPLVVQEGAIADGRLTLGGFSAMCGLLEIETSSPIADDVYSVLVELAPGNYRGIKADVI